MNSIYKLYIKIHKHKVTRLARAEGGWARASAGGAGKGTSWTSYVTAALTQVTVTTQRRVGAPQRTTVPTATRPEPPPSGSGRSVDRTARFNGQLHTASCVGMIAMQILLTPRISTATTVQMYIH